MTIIQVRLDDEDRKRYGGDEPLPEQLALDTEWLKDLPVGDLDEIERETNLFLVSLLGLLEQDGLPRSMSVRRGIAYLAVRQAGRRPGWDDFQPRLLRAEFAQEGEAVPPAGPSESSSED